MQILARPRIAGMLYMDLFRCLSYSEVVNIVDRTLRTLLELRLERSK